MNVGLLTFWLNVAFGLIGLGFFLQKCGDVASMGWQNLPTLLGACLWLITPYALLASAARYGRSPLVIRGSLILTILAGVWATYTNVELIFHFTTPRGDKDGLAMLFTTAYQHMVIIPVLALLFVIGAVLARQKQ
jgi:hypothetical protein